MKQRFFFAFLPAFLLACGESDPPSGSSGAGAGATGGTSAAGGMAGATSGGTGGTGGSGGAAAGTGGAGAGTGGASGAAGSAQCGSSTVVAQAASNYTFASNITLKPLTIAPSDPEVTVDWSGLTTDFLGHATSPTADIAAVNLIVFSLTLAEFEEHLNADDGTLAMHNQGALQFVTNNTATMSAIADFGVPGTPENNYRTSVDVQEAVDDYLDPVATDPAENMFVVMPSDNFEPGTGSRMVQAFTVDPASTNTAITIGASTALAPGANGHTGGTDSPQMTVTYDVDLEALTPVAVPAATPALTVDWSQMTTNGLGRPWVPRSLNRALVGRYRQSLTELENQFLGLESLSEDIYSIELPTDEPISLAGAMSEAGQPFPGVDDDGVWVLALFCDPSYCGNPAPWYLTILEPCN